MKNQYQKWNTEEGILKLKEAAENSYSLAGMLRYLGLRPAGGNYDLLRLNITRLGIDTNHHTGQAWNRENYRDLESLKTKDSIRKNLLRDRGHRCELCLIDSWQGIPLTFEMDHIDGNRFNHSIENLRILCPNCHSQTDTYRNKKRINSVEPLNSYNIKELFAVEVRVLQQKLCPQEGCEKLITLRSVNCKKHAVKPTKINWPSNTELETMLEVSNYSRLAKILGVSDNAIRKRLKK